MKHIITIEIPSAQNAKGAVAALKLIARHGRLEEFVTDIKAVPNETPTKPVNPLLRRKP